MPLLKMTQEFRDTYLEDPIFLKKWNETFTDYEYLGTNHNIITNLSIQVYLVSIEGFEPGEYWVDVICTTHENSDYDLHIEKVVI